MGTKLKILLAAIVLLPVFFISCVENLPNNPTSKPTIRIISPSSGDTVQVGKNKISYEASDYPGGSGLEQFEVIIDSDNGRYVEVFEADNGSSTNIYLTVDSTLLGTQIDYFVNVRNKEGSYGTSEVQKGLFVVETVTPPKAPGELVLTKLNTGSVNLFWNDSSKTEDFFELWRKAGSTADYVLYKTLPGNTISYNDNGLSELITYFYKVRAGNKYGLSGFSNEVSTVGGEAFNLQAQTLGASAVLLTWESNEVNILGFRVQRTNPSTGRFEQIAVVGPSVREYTDRNLMSRTTYTYRIASFTSTSQSAWSNQASATTAAVDVPAPTNLTADFNSGERKVIVQWTDNTDQETGTYIERREGTNGSFIQIGNTAADVNIFMDSTVTTQKTYYYRARHLTVEGFYTAYSNVDDAFIPLLPPLKPSTLQIYPDQANPAQFSLVWMDNSEDEDKFEVWVKAGSNGSYQLYQQYPAKTGIGLYGISISVNDINVEYFFKVRAVKNETLASDFSNEVSTKGNTGTITLEIPSDLVTANSVTLRWNDVFENELIYIVERKRESFPADENFKLLKNIGGFTGKGSLISITDNDVTPSTQYTYRVRAFLNTQQYSNYSNERSVYTPAY